MSWAMATRSIRKCKTRIEKTGGSRVDTEPTAWGFDVQVWNLLWTGEEAIKKGIPILKRTGFQSVEDLPRIAVGFSSKSYQDLPTQLRLSATSLSSRCKTYLNVQKRTATPAQINDAQIVTRVPLQYLQLTNMIIPSLPHDVATGQTPHAVIPSSVNVIDGLTDDTMFLLLQSIAPPCDRSADWNRYNTKVIDSTMPCYVTHKISGSLRRVTYFRDILTRQTYASYVDWARTQ